MVGSSAGPAPMVVSHPKVEPVMSQPQPYPRPGMAQPYQQGPPPQPPGSYPQGAQYPVIALTARFEFDGGAATYIGTGILAFLITVCTLGFGIPWAICVRYSWRTKHTLIDGYRLRFTGGGARLFGNWIKWWLLIIITVGIYSFWVVPRLTRWITRHQEFDMSARRVA
jgi:uncharacterized membrane protein YjgN (DUF898 family)